MQPGHSNQICTSRKATQGISTYCTATCYQSNGANVTINSLTTCFCEVTATSQPHCLKHSFHSTQRLCTAGTWVRVACQPGHLLSEKSSASPCWPCSHQGLHQRVDGAATEPREVALHPLQVIWARPSSSHRLLQPTTLLSRCHHLTASCKQGRGQEPVAPRTSQAAVEVWLEPRLWYGCA